MLGIRFLTWIKGNFVGRDELGNRYYVERFVFKKPKDRSRRRWVLYAGKVEASKIPGKWHSWLHFTSDQTPDKSEQETYAWQKEHLPNVSGTKSAYLPTNHPLKEYKVATHYTAWKDHE